MKHFFHTRKVEMSDHSELYEIVTLGGERVATATTAEKLEGLEAALNIAVTQAEEVDRDIVVNC